MFVFDKGDKLFNGYLHAEEWIEPASHGKLRQCRNLSVRVKIIKQIVDWVFTVSNRQKLTNKMSNALAPKLKAGLLGFINSGAIHEPKDTIRQEKRCPTGCEKIVTYSESMITAQCFNNESN